jgi:sugar phosphate isomerase/epimerase
MTTSASRRRFLGTIAGAAGAAALGVRGFTLGAQREGNSSADDNGAYGGFLMGIQSYTLRKFPVERVIEIVHTDLGLSAIEFFGSHFDIKSSDAQIQEIKDATSTVGIKLTSHGVNNFTKNHEANRRIFEFAKKVGLKNITADPTEDSFDSLDKLVAECGIRIAIHNHGPRSRYDKVADVLNAIKGRHQNIGACADLGHFIRSGEDPVKAIHLLAGRLYGIHLKDFAQQTANAKGVILGKGHLDVEAVFSALRHVNFPADGALSLEYEENADDPIADVQQCLVVAADAAQKAASRS